MSEKEEEVWSVVASTWSHDNNTEGTDGYETVNEIGNMEGDWEVIDEVGDSDEENGEPRMVIVRESPQDDPSFEASRLVFVEEGSEQDDLEQDIRKQSPNEQSIDLHASLQTYGRKLDIKKNYDRLLDRWTSQKNARSFPTK